LTAMQRDFPQFTLNTQTTPLPLVEVASAGAPGLVKLIHSTHLPSGRTAGTLWAPCVLCSRLDGLERDEITILEFRFGLEQRAWRKELFRTFYQPAQRVGRRELFDLHEC